MDIDKKLNYLAENALDINEHLFTLKEYASGCDVVVELGVAKPVSTWAFVAARPNKIISVDIVHPIQRGSTLEDIELACSQNNIIFEFRLEDSRSTKLPIHDLLFIDTLHNYDVLSDELRIHSNYTQKYIIMHDTVTFGSKDEFGEGPGLNKAIKEFIELNKNWKIKQIFYNNNGLTILERTF